MQTRLTCYLLLGILALSIVGCATSQEVSSVREDLQKQLQDTRVKNEQLFAQSETKRKAADEMQARLSKEIKAQEQTLGGLTAKVQDLQTRQESLQKERVSPQSTNVALRDTILRALRAEQADLQHRLKKMGEYIKDIEQAESMGMAPKPSVMPAPLVESRQENSVPPEKQQSPDGGAKDAPEAPKPVQ